MPPKKAAGNWTAMSCRAWASSRRSRRPWSIRITKPHWKGLIGGRGVGAGWWPNFGGPSTCNLEVQVDGTVGLATGSTDLQGTRTTIAMQAAEVLGVRAEDVASTVTDTNSTGFNLATGGSRVTYATGIAAIQAAGKALAEMRLRASRIWQVDPASVVYAKGVFTTTADATLRMTFKEVAASQMSTGGPIFVSSAVDPNAAGSSMGVHIADVEVDPETGKVTVLRYTSVQDAGKAIHPSFVEGQLQGWSRPGHRLYALRGVSVRTKRGGYATTPSRITGCLPSWMCP